MRSLGQVVVFVFLLMILSCKSKNTNDTKTMKVAIWGEIPHMNPFYPTDEKIWGLQSLIWEPFVRIDDNGKWHSVLAKSWQWSDNNKKIILDLPKDLKWSDGSFVTEKDISFSFNFHKYEILKASHWSPVFKNVKSVSFKGTQLTVELNNIMGIQDWNGLLSMTRLLPFSVTQNFDSEIKKLKGTGLYQVKNFSSVRPWGLEHNPFYRDLDLQAQYPATFQINKMLSESLVLDFMNKEKGFAFVDYGLLPLLEKVYFPFRLQKINKVLAFNLEDDFLKNKEHRRCLLQVFPSATEIKKTILTAEPEFKLKQITAQGCLYQPAKTINVVYRLEEDKKLIEMWQENLKPYGLILDLNNVSESKMSDLLKSKKYQIFISDMLENYAQYPMEVFHSKGAYNSQGWNDNSVNELIEVKQRKFDYKDLAFLNAKIRQRVSESLGLIYIYNYNRPLGKTKVQCKEDEQMSFWESLLRCYSLHYHPKSNL